VNSGLPAAALRVGALALAGLVLLVLAAVLAGGSWFAATERAMLRFETSVFGLQAGAPVVLRGVQVGQVDSVALAPLAGPTAGDVASPLVVPVTVRFERERLLELLGGAAPAGGTAIAELARQGLFARLATQSLLTGQLYVELDLDPARRATAAASPVAVAGALPQVPTAPTRLQSLEAQLAGLDLAQIGRDLAATAASARQLLAGGDAQRTLAQIAKAAEGVQALTTRLDRELGPIAGQARGTLGEAQRTLDRVGRSAEQVGRSAEQAGDAAAEWQQLAREGRPLVAELRRSADEIGRAAATLGEAAGPDSPLRADARNALTDLSRAARSLRELSELLERHPDALLRGRGGAP